MRLALLLESCSIACWWSHLGLAASEHSLGAEGRLAVPAAIAEAMSSCKQLVSLELGCMDGLAVWAYVSQFR